MSCHLCLFTHFLFSRLQQVSFPLLNLYLIVLFLGGSAAHRKISWVDWNSICRSKEVGGLGVRRIREFNVALLGKWCWRLLEERDSLWFRVLSARYGTDEGRLRGGGREASEWWCVVHSLSRENWFGDHVSRRVGNGRTTLFWSDMWCGVAGCLLESGLTGYLSCQFLRGSQC